MSKLEAEKIDVGWPDPGYVDGLFATSIAATVRDMEYFGCMGKIHRVDTPILMLSRNKMVQMFLEGESEWLWTVDSDMVFDKRHPMKLWETANEHNVKMVSGLAFMFQQGGEPVPSIFYDSEEEPGMIGTYAHQIPTEPMRVAATGLASTLIHRDVFEAMPAVRSETYRWFDLLDLADEGTLSGEDVQFFLRAKKLGFDLMVNPDAETWHIKPTAIGKPEWHRHWELRVALAERKADEQQGLVINHDED